MTRSSIALSATFVVTLATFAITSFACRDNTTCTTGTRLCTDNDGNDYTGNPFKGGGTQLRVCATTGAGADADGEFVVDQDCGKKNEICFTDNARDADAHNFDGCIDPKCSNAGALCVTEGSTSCELSVSSVCSKNADGCLVWTTQEDCSTAGKGCTYQNDVAVCQ